ncbi:hypothetical protein B0H15DRAFT_461019 [Mycena belliarum]|uniref:Uncharacterized protein n=1 Tax=Mycena belliarum TaxID=1033014 RepID=A0AAD6UGR0_9AGAR|nr:hypothetical protein B0H15DRAFT_461019 [Mycena belliae]
MVLGAEEDVSPRTAERLAEFVADPAKVGATRCLNVTLVGPYICGMPAVKLLSEKLHMFVNVTHVSFDCIRSQNVFGWQTPARTVRHAVEVLPSLLSISVVGCNAEVGEELEDMDNFREELSLPVPKLLHAATRFCHPNLSDIWCQCPNVRVLELEGREPEEYWRDAVATDEIKQTTETSTEIEMAVAESLSQSRGYTVATQDRNQDSRVWYLRTSSTWLKG